MQALKLAQTNATAAAERALEWAIRRHYGVQTEVIHALTNGAEGDIAPAFTTQNFAEAEQLGLTLATKAFDLFQELDTRLTDAVQLGYNYEELPLQIPYTADDMELCQHGLGRFALQRYDLPVQRLKASMFGRSVNRELADRWHVRFAAYACHRLRNRRFISDERIREVGRAATALPRSGGAPFPQACA